MPFPKDFVWGTATSAFQIEGAAFEDGKGSSIWDAFCHSPGNVWRDQPADVACDHYHRYQDDIALLKRLGIKAHRFSISWPRVLPLGTGTVNGKGVDFYDRLVDGLLAAGVDPYITLYHWDLPLELDFRGGWLNRDIAGWFGDYTDVVVRRLGDRVRNWMTFNEINAFVMSGYRTGTHAPGRHCTLAQLLRIGHHVLLSHGTAVQVIRGLGFPEVRVSYVPVGFVQFPVPASDSPRDIDAARSAFLSIPDTGPGDSTWWYDPVFFGTYPENGLGTYDSAMPEIRTGDMELISQPLDYLCVNIYGGTPVSAAPEGGFRLLPWPTNQSLSMVQWPLTPSCIYWAPRFLAERYKIPVIISENGLSLPDVVSLDGKVHDPQRIDATHRYLRELERAVDDGIDIHGYFHWSIIDDYEWDSAMSVRYGLCYVNYETQERIPKDSAYWYRDVIARNGLE